jgi:RNA-directed DNA polymerase
MTVLQNIGAVSTPLDWNSINWDRVEQEVMKLQVRIAKATKQGRWNKVKALQWLLTHSFSAKCMAVRRVTTNRGKNTPGGDGVVLKKDEDKYRMVQSLSRRNYAPQPLRRIYIPKGGDKKKLRPLGIPTALDRSQQALHSYALTPLAETTADPNSYGFRPQRSTADAIEGAFIALGKKSDPQWILEGDIKGCFDNISHDWILDNVCMDKVILQKWLKAGYMEKAVLFPTDKGTPQGGLVSPCIANLVLDGLESLLNKAFTHSGRRDKKGRALRQTYGVRLIRYADDFIITGRNKEILEQEIKPMITSFLKERGLELSQDKTKITHITDGFDFLGQNVRKYKLRNGKMKMLIKPSAKNIHTFLMGIRTTIKKMATAKQVNLIGILNSKIRGWANYHSHVVSKEVFNKVDYEIWMALWCWAKRRHPKKDNRWISDKYFHPVKGVNRAFSCAVTEENGNKKQYVLFTASSIPIIRHTKIKSAANPFDPVWDAYFEERISNKMHHNQEGDIL